MNLLIADDNKQIISILSQYAKKEGYTVYTANDGEEALERFQERTYDMVLLDVMMPKLNGFEVCKQIRKESMVPIIIITARGEDFERIMGLDIGADDYIVKPFSPPEIMARIRAINRRIEHSESQNTKQLFRYDNLEVDLDDFTARIAGEKLNLTKKEIELLWILSTNIGKVFTREHLLNSLWGYDYYGDNRTVDSHIKRLRAKLDVFSHPKWDVKTVWGMGYKFETYE